MKFSFLGICPLSETLADAIVAHPHHQLVSIHGVAPPQTPHRFGPIQWQSDWEAVLHNVDSDLVVISPIEDLDQQEDRLRRVLQCELPAIAVQPYCTVLGAFEMAMIQAQTLKPLISYIPADHHPFTRIINSWITTPSTSPIGPISQITIHAGTATMERRTVLRSLAYDIPIARNLVGRIRQVSADSSGLADQPFANLNVSLKTDHATLVTWNLDPNGDPQSRRLHFSGARGTLQINLAKNHADWDVVGEAPKDLMLPSIPSPANLFLDTLDQSLANTHSPASWLHWCQDLEVAETIPASLRRRRTIDILDEKRTEEGSFKGIMSITGCGLLIATLLLLLVGSIIEGFRMPSRRQAYELNQETPTANLARSAPERSIWIRLWPFYPFLLFLMLQLFRFVIRPANAASSSRPELPVNQRAPPE